MQTVKSERGSSPTAIATLRRLVGYIRPRRRAAALTMLFGIGGFLLSFAYPWIIGNVVDLVLAPRAAGEPESARTGQLVGYAVLGLLTAVGHAVVVFGRGHANVHLGHGIVVDIRRQVFEHLQRLSVHFFSKERTGSILARMMHDVHEATSLVYMGLIVAVLDVLQLVCAFVLLVSISWKLTLACVALFPLYGLVFAVMSPRVRVASERMHGQLARISGNVAEQLAGQALVKMYTAEEREAHRFAVDVGHHHKLVTAQSKEGHLVASYGEILVHIGTTIVFGYGGWLALRGELTAGTMTRFLGYVLIMFGPIRRFADLNVVYQSSLAALKRVFGLLDIEPSVAEPARPCLEPPKAGHVRFDEVRFRYEDGGHETRARLDADDACQGAPPSSRRGHLRAVSSWVIDGVSFEAKPGEVVAVVGPSGAGKSTLLSLLPRLYDTTGGRILVDGVDVRSYSLKALRSAIGVVMQESFVFTGTVRDNIAYGRPDASEQEIVEAARAAHAHDFVMALPNGYDTVLGERGVNLSGGQRQRISIARALLKDPKILVLDEATSALDAESEAIVQAALEVLMKRRTCFVIAHRLSTVRRADKILVLAGGRIVESGSHDELLARRGFYARLVRNQAA